MDKHDINEEYIKDNWNKVWSTHNKKFFSFLEKIFYSIFRTQFSSKTVYKCLEKEIDKKEFSIVECGCGSGMIQKKMFKEYNCNTSFLDISTEALRFAKSNMGNLSDNEKIRFIEGSILSIPEEDNSYDYVWNSGVLEHFNIEDQKKAISEMYRITKPGGKVIILIPSTHGKVYMKMKKRAEKFGTWRAGYEKPLASMIDILPDDIDKSDYREYSCGFISQLHYLKFLFKKRVLINMAIPFLEVVQRVLCFLENKPGYFLVGIIEKR